MGYDRHTFDYKLGKDEIISMLNKLPDDEFAIYDSENGFDMADLMQDFNDDVYKDGWWLLTTNV